MRSITRALVGVGAAVLVIGSVRADAQVMEPLRFQTTFPFTVEQMNFPAGHYTIRPVDDLDPFILEISDGKTTKILEVESAGGPSDGSRMINPDDEVVFTKIGDRYVLREIWDAAERSGVVPIPMANHVTSAADAQTKHHHHAA
jgi:hypothetical protein